MLETQPYIVYIKTDAEHRVRSVDSSAYLKDVDGWIEIDKGYGVRHSDARGNYFPMLIYNMRHICRYMIAPIADDPDREAIHTYEYEGETWGIYERTQAEMDADYVPYVPPTDPKELEIAELKQQVAALSAALLDL